MRTFALCCAGLSVLFLVRCTQPEPAPSQAIHAAAQQDFDSLGIFLETRLLPLARHSRSTDSLQKAFLAGRLHYKRNEHLIEYFLRTSALQLNGPPLPEIEAEENRIFEPGGFQVVEEYLFPAFDTAQRAGLVQEVQKMQAAVRGLKMYWEVNSITDAHLADAVRLQVFRLSTLGLAGFDAPVSKNAMRETAVSLEAMSRHLDFYGQTEKGRPALDSVQRQLAGAAAYLRQHPDFDTFDRMHFLTAHANPLSAQLWRWQQAAGIPFVTDIRALRPDARTLFDKNVFDPDFYTNFEHEHRTPAKVALGQKLFFDPVLSLAGGRSCASCHQPGRAFTDGVAKSENIHRTGLLARNTPTLLNAALQKGQFYDFRTATLESQAHDVIENRDEMHGSLQAACRTLHRDPAYAALFRAAFPDTRDSIRPFHIQNALASYERTLISLNSRFDKYVRGDKTQMNAEEVEGFNLFMGKAKCGACHFMPLFNGTVPPGFTKTESEVIGVPATATGKALDPDRGRFAINPLEPWKNAFKTTTVRNAALTAPYMHNGVYRTLEEVVDFYDQGGGAGLGFEVPNQTLPFDKLHLTAAEKKAVVAFMHTLTDVPAPL